MIKHTFVFDGLVTSFESAILDGTVRREPQTELICCRCHNIRWSTQVAILSTCLSLISGIVFLQCRKGNDDIYSRSSTFMDNGVLLCIYQVDGDLLISVFANLGGDHRGYGKVNLPHVVFGTRWELNSGRGIRISHRVPLHYGLTSWLLLQKNPLRSMRVSEPHFNHVLKLYNYLYWELCCFYVSRNKQCACVRPIQGDARALCVIEIL